MVSDLAQPVAPVALYVLVLSVLALSALIAINTFSHQPSQLRLTASLVFGLLAAVSAVLLTLQSQKPQTATQGVLASYVEPIGAIQAQLFGLKEDVARIAETTDAIDERTKAIDETTRATQEAIGKVKLETSNDPRKELNNMGIEWGENPFRQRIKEGDTRAVSLFIEGGMKLSGPRARFWVQPYYLYDDDFDPAVADLLMQNDAIEAEGLCIDRLGDFDVYFIDSRLPYPDKRREVLRHVCATPEMRKTIAAQIKAEEDRLKLVEQGNAQRSANIQTCIRDFRASNPVGPTIDAAARFSIFSVSTLRAPDDVVLADLNSWLMMGGRGDPQQAYDAAVTKGCEQANPAGKIDRTKLEKLQSVAEFLK